MSVVDIVKDTPLSMVELKVEIEKIKKRDKELSFRTQRTEEYLNQFVGKEAKKLMDALKKLKIARLKEEHVVKIVDLVPRTVEDLKVVLQGFTVTVTKDNLKKIIDEVSKFKNS